MPRIVTNKGINGINKINPNIIFAIGGIAILYFGGRKILQALGVVNDSTDTAAQNFKDQNFWNYNKFLTDAPPSTLLLSSAFGYNLAEQIYNSYGYFNDDEDTLFSIFRNLKTKSQVASLAYWFNKKYNKDLINYISSFLNSSELLALNDIIKVKPNYKA